MTVPREPYSNDVAEPCVDAGRVVAAGEPPYPRSSMDNELHIEQLVQKNSMPKNPCVEFAVLSPVRVGRP